MKSVFFLDVDTQRDFILPGGALYVPAAERVIPKFRRLFEFARRNEITVLSSTDAHTPDDPEFKEFPPHCVQGTEGQRKIDDTLLPRPLVLENKPIDRNLLEVVRRYQQIILQKQTLDVFDNPVTERLMRVLPSHAIVFGVTTEYCVRKAALGLRRLGIKTAVVSDAVRALAPQSGEEAIEEMRKAGCEFVTVETLMGVYEA
jgi:nicotinamidase/pyrazinamidase